MAVSGARWGDHRRAVIQRFFGDVERGHDAGLSERSAARRLDSAYELLNPGETGFFIYTDGLNLKLYLEDETGENRWWVLNPERHFDRVFIVKNSRSRATGNPIYSGECTGIEREIGGNQTEALQARSR
jgi:hypothetical protein